MWVREIEKPECAEGARCHLFYLGSQLRGEAVSEVRLAGEGKKHGEGQANDVDDCFANVWHV